MVATVVRHVRASESRIVRVSSAGDAGTGWPVWRQYSPIRSGMSPGVAKRGSSGSITLRPPGSAAAAATRSAASLARPWVAHVLRHSSRSQRPVTFLSSRTVPSTPNSLVTFADNASPEVIGAAISQPTNDHVPHEMYMPRRSARSGMPATALAVSWLAAAITRIPSTAGSTPRTVPRSVPGSCSSGSRSRRSPRSVTSSSLHDRVPTSSSWVVLALVMSLVVLPHRARFTRSGTISNR